MIQIDNVSKFIKGLCVLRDISFDIKSGSVVAFVGPNGSGKTMLMRVIAGLVRPTCGNVTIDGTILGKSADFPKSVGMLLEGPSFLDEYTGLGNLKLLASIKCISTIEDMRNALDAVGLDPDDRRKYRSYSLGMKQRLGIAGAFMEHPSIVLLDEPTNALDIDGIALVQELITAERSRGTTIVLACHDDRVVKNVADEVWHLAEGHLDGHEVLKQGNR